MKYVSTDGIEVDVVHFTPGDDLPSTVDTQKDAVSDAVLKSRNVGDQNTANVPTIGDDPFGTLVLGEDPDDPEAQIVTGIEHVEVYVVTFPDGTVKTVHPSVFDTEFKEV